MGDKGLNLISSTKPSLQAAGARNALRLLAVSAVLVGASVAVAAPLATTRNDFSFPGTQPLAIVDEIAIPDNCTACHAGYGEPEVEPWRAWQGSMMAQSGRDPVTFAAMAIANQDANAAGELCLRCHLPKGWLEGRSVPEDGTAMTADDRHGVQCSVCHRMVDRNANVGNPPEDAAILAALTAPVVVIGNAQMIIDPLDRLRGPFDVVADLGGDPHSPNQETLISPYHKSSELCGTCHNVKNPAFTRQPGGEYVLNALDTPGDAALGFPEQSTYDEWLNSEYATTGVYAPQFGGNEPTVSTCQDCHMKAVTGRDANLGIERDDLPFHSLVGANTFTPLIIPDHPVFGAEVDADILKEGADRAHALLQRSATLSASIDAGELTVRVTNETGHKLPTGYPDGRRMWLHVRAFDENRGVVLESGRYVDADADIVGFEAEIGDPDYDPNLLLWEAVQGMDAAVAALTGHAEGTHFHLALSNVRFKDNRIPPRGFTNAAYEAFDGQPVGRAFADGQYWDDVVYPVGPEAVGAEVTLYYQTISRAYVEFLRDENVTNIAGPLLFDLWEANGKSQPVVMGRAWVEPNPKLVERCRKTLGKSRDKFFKMYSKEWGKCYATEAVGLPCDEDATQDAVDKAAATLRARIGGIDDKACSAASFQPSTLGHGGFCPAPCADLTLFDNAAMADCAVCLSAAVANSVLDAGYGVVPTNGGSPATTVGTDAKACQRRIAKASTKLAKAWIKALSRCERNKLTGKIDALVNCSSDPDGLIAKAQTKADKQYARCSSFASIAGCAEAGDAVAVGACVEALVGAVVEPYVEVTSP
ncbi:MAG: hypothetical protein ACI91F_001731 [Candidatus Binatia bacterium]|jgi:hypothetical protein